MVALLACAIVLGSAGQRGLGARAPISESAASDICEPSPSDAFTEGSDTNRTLPYRPKNDWAWLCRYRLANQPAIAGPPPGVVFFGDSITEKWASADPAFFAGGTFNRGIGGQTSAQMVLRFYQDVVALRPRAVHLVAGTNDVARNAGAMGPESYKNNIRAMVNLARAHGISVIIGSIPPARSFYWRPEVSPGDDIRRLNGWIRDFSARCDLEFVDYYAGMAAPDGGPRSELFDDGVHPNQAGYELMRRLAESAITRTAERPAAPVKAPVCT